MSGSRWRIVVLFLCLCLSQAAAQSVVPDSLARPATSAADTATTKLPDTLRVQTPSLPAATASPRDLSTAKAWKPNSTRALLYSALLPGAGQIYNRKYWKLPIVWGAFTGCGYAILWNNKTYTEYRKAYADFMSGDLSQTAWHNFLPFGADPADYVKSEQLRARLKRGTEYYRRNRDLSIIITLGVYFLTMLDAYVDAELFDFNISPDLSFHFSPTVGTDDKSGLFRYGVSCGLTF